MIRVLTVNEMQQADKFTIENLGVSESELISRAGNAVKEEIERIFVGGRVLFVCGKGNNGKDGVEASKLLKFTHGFSVNCINADETALIELDKPYDIIVDCIFGTGLKREVTGVYKAVIEKINCKKAKVVSVDIPSGLNGDNGLPLGVAVKADYTICIQELKVGLLLNDGRDYSGEISTKDIGISIWGEDFISVVDGEDCKSLFPKRDINTHKGSYGKTAIIGGSKNYCGSVMLAENALIALNSGVGYSVLAVPESLYNIYACKIPESIVYTFNDENGVIKFNKSDYEKFLSYDSLSIGTGMTVCEDTYQVVKYFLENYLGNIVIDADGLNALSKYGVDILKNKKCKCVLTPHIKEFARLIGKTVEQVNNSPIELAKTFAKEYGVVLVLKSATTIVTDGERVVLSLSGTPAMAKGGSGDILSGFTAGLLARSNDIFKVGYTAPFVLGKAGELAVKEKGEYCMIATDEINKIPQAIKLL